MMWDEGMNSSGWIMMTVVMVAFLAVVVLGAIALFGRDSTNKTLDLPASGHSPLQTLDERFARGEIDDDYYRARREALRSDQ